MCGIGNCFSDRVHRLFQSEKRKTVTLSLFGAKLIRDVPISSAHKSRTMTGFPFFTLKRSSEREVETLQSTDPSCDSAGSFCHRAGDGAFVAWGKPRLLAGKIYFCDHIFAR